MNVLLTSCGLETKAIEDKFMAMLPKDPADIKAMFIPTAANYPDAIEVLPKCLEDLLKIGIKRENITVNDLHYATEGNLRDSVDVIYLCGGSPAYLLQRINENGFRKDLFEFIKAGGVVLGVSAGSIVFADNLPDNLGLLKCPLDVHCSLETREAAGSYNRERTERIKLGDLQGIVFEEDELIVFE